jgi:hypothetical protein
MAREVPSPAPLSSATKLLRDYVEQHPPTLPSSPKRLEFVFEMCHPAVADGSLAWARRFDLVSGAFEEAARLFAGLTSALGKNGLSRNFRAGLITQRDPKHGKPEMFYC